VLVAAVIFLGYRTVQTEPHLKAVQSELDSANRFGHDDRMAPSIRPHPSFDD